MHVETVPIGTLQVNPSNPRTIKDAKFKQLVKSIKDFPQMLRLRPIVVDESMMVLGGNMRLRACKEAGLKHVPVIQASELTEAQRKEFIIKDNVGFGEWDWEALANEWEAEDLAEWGLDVPDFAESAEDEKGNFDDPGISDKTQFGVIVICESAGTQESVYSDLTNMGFTCKIVVT